MSKIDIRKASQELRNIWVIGNEYLQKAQPWAIFKNDENQTRMIIRFSFNLIYFYSFISEPFIPCACDKIRKHFGFTKTSTWPKDLNFFMENVTYVKDITPPDILFPKITDKEKEVFREKYSGLAL